MVKRKQISMILTGFILLTIISVSVVFYNYRNIATRGKVQVAKISEDVGISVGKVQHTATREGVTEWQIDAQSADFFPEKEEVVFKNLTAVIFLENQREVTLTAEEGVLKKDTNDIEVSGNVLVKDDMFRLKTSRLYYEHQNQTMTSPVAVEVISGSWELEADSMAIDLNTRKTRFEGKVKGILGETFML